MIGRFVRDEQAGYTFLELIIVSALVGLMTSLLMPAVQGYQANTQVRTVALQAITQFRQARMYALAQDQQINALFQPTGDLPSRGNVQGWEFCTTSASCGFSSTWSTTDPAMIRTIVPNSVNITAYCYRGGFTPTGQYLNWTGACASPGATTEAICFSAGGSNPTKIYVTVRFATGEATLSGVRAGACP
jgi:type II secretory pathway pseudopilin PulG